MSGELTKDNLKQYNKKYIKVFLALLVFTAITIAVSYLHVGVVLGIFIAMVVALTKGTLVAGFFMHLFDENKILLSILVLTVFMFLVLLLLPVLTSLSKIHQ